MAVKREIRTTLALDGENEYKKALSEAQRGLRVLGSELKLASTEFETNGDQQAFLTAKSRTLRSEIAQQEEIVRRVFLVRLKTNEEIKRQRVAKVTGEGAGGDKTVRRQPVVKKIKVGPNDPCPCGSGKKYKKCCRDKDLAAERGQQTN